MKTFKTIKGDLLAATRGFIIHGCNNQGVMGSGVAAGVRARYPHAYAVYKQTEAMQGLKIGSCSFCQVTPELVIVNAVTQTLGTHQLSPTSRSPLSMTGLSECFVKTLVYMNTFEYATGLDAGALPLLFPMIGAGRAGGDWDEISDVIHEVNETLASQLNVKRELVLYTVDVEPTDCR